MAFDGITVSSIVKELNDNLTDGRISKIAQPEPDELLLTVKTPTAQKRLLISASASLPLIYLSDENKQSPITAPNFCMLLRKHIQNGRIIRFVQPSLERVIFMEIEHLDEMGDLKLKKLAIEIMGKHSNIIFLDENKIIDSIKHISASVSSVREVLPGREYFIPKTDEKQNPLEETKEGFINTVLQKAGPIYKAIYSSYTGFSPFYSQQICHMAGIDGDAGTDSPFDKERLADAFIDTVNKIKQGYFAPAIVYENGVPFEYASLPLPSFKEENTRHYDTISELLKNYYAEKELVTRIRQKSVDLRKIVQTTLEKDLRKQEIYIKQLKDTEKKDKYKVYGELLTAYGYGVPENAKSITVLNYYTNENTDIPLDPDMSAIDNAKKYFDKYGKLKRTEEAVNELIKEVNEEIDHLYSIQNALDIAQNDDDLSQIKEELSESGYIKKHTSGKKIKSKSKPFHYVTKEGFHIYVGKNNIQNEDITFNLANGNDWWFHAKKIPGSHVIVKTEGKELPDSVFEDAARLAAHYSKARGESRIEVDYVRKKEVKHPNGSKPGFVVYYTNYSMLIDSNISHIELIKE